MPYPRLNIRRECTHGGKHSHGTTTAYHQDRCRCQECSDAKSAALRRHRKDVAYGRHKPYLIDAAPVREHLLELRARGIGYCRAAELAGVGRACTARIVEGHQPSVKRPIAEAILAVPLDADPYPRAFIDATGTRRRIQALACLGWSFPAQLALLGRSTNLRNGLRDILSGGKTTAPTAKAVRDLYDRLWDKPPQPVTAAQKITVTKTRRLAERKGWAPPLAWDDIDDPECVPSGKYRADRRRHAPEAVIEDLEWLIRTGATPEQAAARLGMGLSGIEQAMRRVGRLDLARWITRKDAA